MYIKCPHVDDGEIDRNVPLMDCLYNIVPGRLIKEASHGGIMHYPKAHFVVHANILFIGS